MHACGSVRATVPAGRAHEGSPIRADHISLLFFGEIWTKPTRFWALLVFEDVSRPSAAASNNVAENMLRDDDM